MDFLIGAWVTNIKSIPKWAHRRDSPTHHLIPAALTSFVSALSPDWGEGMGADV